MKEAARILVFIVLMLVRQQVALTQTLGGTSTFNFLKLSNTPQLTALGGVNISQPSNDIGLAFNNPALLKASMHTQLNAVFNNFYGNSDIYHLALGYHSQKLNTSFSWGVHYFNYGDVANTDAAGNILGRFHPVDWVMQVGASRSYLDKWNYGINLKFISSNYGIYRSNGLAVDIGVLFTDTSRGFNASVVIMNAGSQLKQYQGAGREDLPFDLQAGLTQRLKGSPFSFSLTAQHLQRFNIRYNDTSFNNNNGIANSKEGKFSIGKLVDHLVLASTIHAGDKIELYLGYNFLRRRELNSGSSGNGFNGFSVGMAALFNKLQLRYARAWYQGGNAYDQFGISLPLNKYFGLGAFGKKINW